MITIKCNGPVEITGEGIFPEIILESAEEVSINGNIDFTQNTNQITAFAYLD